MSKCFIYGAGPESPILNATKSDYIIAVDGGLSILEKNKIKPNLIVGDFDSLGYVPNLPNTEVFPPEKDDTDMMIAVKKALMITNDEILISGGFGGRPDHTIANFQCLNYINKQKRTGFLIGNTWSATLISDGATIEFPNTCQGYFSVFSFTENASGVYIKNAEYPLNNAYLTQSFPLGTSNCFTPNNETIISVFKGTLLILWENKMQYLNNLPKVI